MTKEKEIEVDLDEVGELIGNTEILKKEKVKDNIVEDPELTDSLFNEFSSYLENKHEMSVETLDKITIPTGIDLVDAILGGGFVVGGLNIIVGQPGSGKSMLAIQTLAQGQRQYKGKLLGGFLDSEEATTSQRLSNLGVRYPKLKPYTDITVEKVFRFIEGVCLFKDEKKIVDTPSVIIWDSIANTLSQKEREVDDINSVIGYKARLLSILVPKYVAKCTRSNICLIAVNQMRDVLSMGQFTPPKDLKFMSHSKDVPGGTALKYNAFHLVEMKVGKVLTQDKYGFDGVITKLKCVKNKLFPPNIEIEILGSFNTGFSNFWTNYQFLIDNKRLNSGAWNYLVSFPEKKFRTKDAENLYNTDEEFKQKFDEAAKELIQTEIIDKYNPKQESNEEV